jgi:hypothetical protein
MKDLESNEITEADGSSLPSGPTTRLASGPAHEGTHQTLKPLSGIGKGRLLNSPTSLYLDVATRRSY